MGKHFMILSVRLVPGLTVLSTEAVKRSENEASECRWHFEYDASDDSWSTRGEEMNTSLVPRPHPGGEGLVTSG